MNKKLTERETLSFMSPFFKIAITTTDTVFHIEIVD